MCFTATVISQSRSIPQIQGTRTFDFCNYWKLHEHIESMRTWFRLQLCYFKVVWYIITKKSVVVYWKQCDL